MIPGNNSILVISDSHGNVAALTAALTWASQLQLKENSYFSSAIFLGDGEGDLISACTESGFNMPWHIVRGNSDFDYTIPKHRIIDLPGLYHSSENEIPARKLFLAHGSNHSVKEDLRIIAAAAKAFGAEAALFGHTHIHHCSMLDGIFLLNPGSIGRPRTNYGPTFAVLECQPGKPLEVHFYYLARNSGSIVVKELF